MENKGLRSRIMRKYRLTIHNENKLENVMGFYISPFWVIISLFFSFLLVAGVIFLILAFTPVGEYFPGYVSNKTRETLVNYAISIDSLREEVDKQDRYLTNIKNIMEGRVEVGDTTIVSDSLINFTNYPIETTELEEAFVQNFEESERYNLTSQATSIGALQGVSFFRPCRGMIMKSFDPKAKHYGVDIAENPNESVLAIWDGSIIMSDYTANDGYMVVIQHNENLVSVYRNCYRIFKAVGDKVIAGEVIATLSSGDYEDTGSRYKPYLHLELWHKGEPLDPAIYLPF